MAYPDDRARLDRRRGMAQALIQMGGQPQGFQAGRIFTGPTTASTLASLASIVAGGIMDRRLEKKERALDEGHRSELVNALRAFTGESAPAIPGVIDESGATGTPPVVTGIGDMAKGSMPVGPAADPRRAAAMAVLQGLPLDQMQGLVGQQAIASLFPKPQKLEPVDLGNEIGFRDDSGNIVRRVPKGAAPQGKTDDQREYEEALQQGYKGTLQDWIVANKKAGATSVNVNTKGSGALAEGLGGERSKTLSALYSAAQSAPQTIERAERVKQLLQTVPYTGAVAEWKLAVGKAAKAAGLNYAGDDIANTEMLARELGQNVLDTVKTSGLAGSQGLTEGERRFLLQIVGGNIELDANTLARVADLNQRMAKNTMQRWNAEAARVEAGNAGLLETLGMATIDMPADTPAPGARPKLQKNPDGSYTYTP